MNLIAAIPATCEVLPLTNVVRLFGTSPIVNLKGAVFQPQMHTLLHSGKVWLITRPGGKLQG